MLEQWDIRILFCGQMTVAGKLNFFHREEHILEVWHRRNDRTRFAVMHDAAKAFNSDDRLALTPDLIGPNRMPKYKESNGKCGLSHPIGLHPGPSHQNLIQTRVYS
jgi:hypothetical protein